MTALRFDPSLLAALILAAYGIGVFLSVAAQNLAAAMGWVLVLAAEISGRCRKAESPAPWPRGLVIPLAVFAAASAISALASVSPAAGWRATRSEVLALGLLFAARGVRRPAQARAVVAVLLTAAAAAGLWSLYQVVVVFDGVSHPGRRATGFWHLDASVSYGNMLATCFAMALALAAFGAPRIRVRALAAAAAMAIGMVLSYIRGAWLAATLVVVAVAAVRRSMAILLGLVLLASLVLVVPAGRVVVDRVLVTFDPTFVGNADRLARYGVAANVIRDHPVLGTGPGVLRLTYDRYARPGAMVNSHLHNTYLQLTAERGPLAMLAWGLLVGWAALHVVQGSVGRAPTERALALGVGLALAVVLVLGVFNYIWEDWRIRSLLLVLIGLAWSPALAGSDGAPGPGSGERALRPGDGHPGTLTPSRGTPRVRGRDGRLGTHEYRPHPGRDRLYQPGIGTERASEPPRDRRKEAWEAFAAAPITGAGFGYVRRAHNIHLQLLHAGGVIGPLSFAVFAVGALREGLSRRRTCAGAPSHEVALMVSALVIATAVWLSIGLVQNRIYDRFLYVQAGLILALGARRPGAADRVGGVSRSVHRRSRELHPRARLSENGSIGRRRRFPGDSPPAFA